MGYNFRSFLQLIGIAILIMSLTFWLPIKNNRNLILEIWMFRIIGLPLSIGLLIYTFKKPPKDKIPDYLRSSFHERCIFERGGLSFVVGYALKNGVFNLLVYYQNRFDRMCVATIRLNGVPKFMRVDSDLAPVVLPLRVGGGEYGAATIPYAVPADCRGKQILFHVSADVTYPAGKGNLLRFSPGFGVGRLNRRAPWFPIFERRIKIPVPEAAPDRIPPGLKIEIDILDKQNLSGGFEVIPIVKTEEGQKPMSS